jgi:hypothetical protein
MTILLGNRLEFLVNQRNRSSLNLLLRFAVPTTNRIVIPTEAHPDFRGAKWSDLRFTPGQPLKPVTPFVKMLYCVLAGGVRNLSTLLLSTKETPVSTKAGMGDMASDP